MSLSKIEYFKTLIILFLVEVLVGCSDFTDWVSYNNRGQAKYEEERFSDAVELYKIALKNVSFGFYTDIEGVAYVNTNIAAAYRAMGDYENAKQHYLAAISGWEKYVGKSHENYAIILNNYVYFLKDMGNFEEALEYANDCLDIRKEILNPSDFDLINTLMIISNLHLELGQVDLALRALDVSMQDFDASNMNNIDAGEIEIQVAEMYFGLGEDEKSLQYAFSSLKKFQKTLPSIHTKIADVKNLLALIKNKKGQFIEAAQLYQDAIEIYVEIYGGDHQYVGTSMANAADNYTDMGDYNSAKNYHEKSLSNLIKNLGESHPRVAWKLHNYAYFENRYGDQLKAFSAIKQAIQIRMQTLGADNVNTRESIEYCISIAKQFNDEKFNCTKTGRRFEK